MQTELNTKLDLMSEILFTPIITKNNEDTITHNLNLILNHHEYLNNYINTNLNNIPFTNVFNEKSYQFIISKIINNYFENAYDYYQNINYVDDSDLEKQIRISRRLIKIKLGEIINMGVKQHELSEIHMNYY